MKRKKDSEKLGVVDVGSKKVTKRSARASAEVRLSQTAFKALLDGECPKGDVLATAKVAGIMAAKSTPQIIPLCHPILLNKVNITFNIHNKTSMITIFSEVKSEGKTGVEMEALSAVSVSALTIYDMMKWADKGIVISEVKLLEKTGGKSGDYKRK
ncbi:MAG: cyclic pyranopterin monophosphate synthase MoaC [Candidatus Omnitrophica bacterium]|nr:cyclic pyranopterin monophosphate synthase MoaC [Candidatus Omnitrophota bacterium]